MDINTTVNASNAALDGGPVNPVMLWAFALIGVIAVVAFFAPVVALVVQDMVKDLRYRRRVRQNR